jgi:eukaryotic-like serine/threonine-protein kinase
MATRGDAYWNERDQRGGTVGAERGSARPTADARAAARAARIADRYHLEDRISESGQSTLWRAFDDVLGRPVTVRTFRPGFAGAADVVAAARAACRVPDHRLVRVFDAHVAADGAYIVTEWPAGENLEDLLLLGLLDVGWVTSIVAEVASALAAAHAAGIAHLRLTPRSVVWSRDAGVKILGLGVDAALAAADAAAAAAADAAVPGAPLRGAAADNAAVADAALAHVAPGRAVPRRAVPGSAMPGSAMPGSAAPGSAVRGSAAPAHAAQEMAEAAAAAALADTRALGQLLYAALTACWPGQQQTALPRAPHRDGRPYRPRQVRAGVPARIDEITCRALFAPLPRDPAPITSPGQLAEVLTGALHYESRPPASAVPLGATFIDSMDGTVAAESTGGFEAAAIGHPAWPRRRRRVRTLAAGGVLGALFFLDSAIIGISLLGAAHAPNIVRSVAHTQQPAPRPHRPPGRLLEPASAEAFDPYGGSGDENNELAPAAIDGNESTAWHTDWYTTPLFGNLKTGSGLVVDMGRSVTITSVRVLLGSIPGANVQLRIGDSADSLGDMGVAAKAWDVGGQISLRPAAAYRGRYVLIWFTKLPPDGGVFQADIYEVAAYGS